MLFLNLCGLYLHGSLGKTSTWERWILLFYEKGCFKSKMGEKIKQATRI